LWIAVAANLLDTAKLLLERGFSQHPVLPEIGVASYYGHYEMVKLLLDNGVGVTTETPMHCLFAMWSQCDITHQ
jgi:ankyrin repeat protein